MDDELERLRAEVAAYRQRELDSLRAQLAEAIAARDNYRAEALRHEQLARQIHAEGQAQIEKLRGKLEAIEEMQAGVRRNRTVRPTVQRN